MLLLYNTCIVVLAALLVSSSFARQTHLLYTFPGPSSHLDTAAYICLGMHFPICVVPPTPFTTLLIATTLFMSHSSFCFCSSYFGWTDRT